MSYQINWEEKGVKVSFSGPFTEIEDNYAKTEVYSDSRSDDLRYIILDFSGITGQFMLESHLDVPVFVDKMCSIRLKQIKMAIVAVDESIKALCLQYIYHSISQGNPWGFSIFDSLAEARNWVNSQTMWRTER